MNNGKRITKNYFKGELLNKITGLCIDNFMCERLWIIISLRTTFNIRYLVSISNARISPIIIIGEEIDKIKW